MKTVTATEAARLLRVADKTIRDWLRKGRFPGAQRVKRNGIWQWSIPLTDIEAVRLEEQRNTESEGGLPSLPELAAQLMALERRVVELEQARLTRISSTTVPLPVAKLHRQSASGDDLPVGYVPLAEFYHGMSHSTLNRYIERGVIAVTHGHWRHKGHAVEKALNPEQQRLFYEQMYAHASFVSCPGCPHWNK